MAKVEMGGQEEIQAALTRYRARLLVVGDGGIIPRTLRIRCLLVRRMGSVEEGRVGGEGS